MGCGHCVAAVKKELGKISGLTIKDVQIGSASVEYDEAKISLDRIKSAVEEAGYTVTA